MLARGGGGNGERGSTPRASGGDSDGTLDALAAILRAFGRFAIDQPDAPADKMAELAETWALHLLIMRPRPGDAPSSTPRFKDIPGAVAFVTAAKKAEQAYVTRALADLRQTVWTFVQSLNRALSDDELADVDVACTLDNLRRVAENGSTEELRRAAISTAATVADAMRARKERQTVRNHQIGERLASLGAQLAEAKRERDCDGLTGLYNRGAFDQFIARAAELRALRREPTSLLMLDVDHFKQINDTHGHPVGDEVLRAIGACLTRTILRKQDFTARYGGEEFAIVLPETELHDAVRLAERVRVAIGKVALPGAPDLRITASIGVATMSPRDDVATLIARADRALYKAKRSGRDCVASLE